jgi:predicted ferric reductase
MIAGMGHCAWVVILAQIAYTKFKFSLEIQILTRNSNCLREIQILTQKNFTYCDSII